MNVRILLQTPYVRIYLSYLAFLRPVGRFVQHTHVFNGACLMAFCMRIDPLKSEHNLQHTDWWDKLDGRLFSLGKRQLTPNTKYDINKETLTISGILEM